MKNNFLFKALAALCTFVVVALLTPGMTKADQKGKSKYGKSMNWKTTQGGHSYRRGSPQQRSHGHSNHNRGQSSYRYPGNNRSSYHSHRGYNHPARRSQSYFNVSPHGFSYGRSSGFNSFQFNVPLNGGFGYSNFYRPYGSYGYLYGSQRSTAYYRPRSFSSYRPYSIPAYGVPGYTNSLPVYGVEQGINQSTPLIPNQYATEQPLNQTRTLKPETDFDRQQFQSNRLNVIRTVDLAEPTQRRAEQAFRLGQYADAARLANEALLIDRENGLLMLFSAQANFAAGYYDQAYNEIGTAISRLPSEQWSYVVANFRQFYGQDDYVKQVERLSNHIQNNPTDARALIIRGYHYGGLGYPDSADNDFSKALSLNPNDTTAQQLQSILGSRAPILMQPEVSQPFPQQAMPPQYSQPLENSVLDADPSAAPFIEGPIVGESIIIDGPVIDNE